MILVNTRMGAASIHDNACSGTACPMMLLLAYIICRDLLRQFTKLCIMAGYHIMMNAEDAKDIYSKQSILNLGQYNLPNSRFSLTVRG